MDYAAEAKKLGGRPVENSNVDYAALAKEHGGRAEEAPEIDYAALAKEHGGSLVKPPSTQTLSGQQPEFVNAAKTAPEINPPIEKGFFTRNIDYAADNLRSGWENLLSGVEGLKQSEASEYVTRLEEKYGPGAVNAPPDKKQTYKEAVALASKSEAERQRISAQQQQRYEQNPQRVATQQFKAAISGFDEDKLSFMESAAKAGDALLSNPVGVIADLGLESTPASLAMVASAVLVRLGFGSNLMAAGAGGTTSAVTEFGNEYAARRDKGIPHDKAWSDAAQKSGVIGLLDAVSMNSAGKSAGVIMDALSGTKRLGVAAKEVAKETGKQAVLGAAGEAGGSLAIGEVPNPAGVLAEAVGEVFGAPLEAVGTYRSLGPKTESRIDTAATELTERTRRENVVARLEKMFSQKELQGFLDEYSAKDPATLTPNEKQSLQNLQDWESTKKSRAAKTTKAAPPQLRSLDNLTEEEVSEIQRGLYAELGRPANEQELRKAFDDYIVEQNAGNTTESGTDRTGFSGVSFGFEDARVSDTGTATTSTSGGLDGTSEATTVSGTTEKNEPASLAPRTVATYLEGLPQDIKRYNTYINNEEVGPLLQSANDAIQRLNDFITGRGYSIDEVNRGTPDQEVQRAKNLASGVAGIAGRMLTKKDGVDRNLQRANPEQLEESKTELETFINDAIENFLTTSDKTKNVIEEEFEEFEDNPLTDENVNEEMIEPDEEEVSSLDITPRIERNQALDEPAGDTRQVEDNKPNPPEGGTSYFGSDEISNTVGKNVNDAVQNIVNDYMVGDEVRVGNMPGVVVGVEGDYVKFRPYSATNPKAYQRVPKNIVTLVSRPDTSTTVAKSAEPEKLGEEAGKLNADMAGLIQLLGANMYASAVAEVSVKELLQNAFDAIKGAVSGKKSPSLYKVGRINISLNKDDRTITITDNARGMSPEIVRNAFFTVAGSDKSDLDPSERSGGLGLAKMGFMLGAERLELVTINNGIKTTVNATAGEIANSDFKLIKTKADPSEHGTTVTVKIPEAYTDPKTGDKKSIWFPSSWASFDALTKPLIGPVEVSVTTNAYGSADTTVLPIGVNFEESKYRKLSVNFSWGTADVYFGIARNDRPSHQILSSGVYQFNNPFALSQNEKIPYDIIVNIKPNVEAKHPDYPFENSRERFKGRLEKDIKSLSTYLAQIARGEEAKDLKENFKNIVSMPRTDVSTETAEASKKLKKVFDKGATYESTGELPPFPTNVSINEGRVLDTRGNTLIDLDKEAEKKKESTFGADEAAPTSAEHMLTMKEDPKLPIFHNNTNVDYITVGEKFGNPQQFFAELGTLLVEMKEALAKSNLWGYDILGPQNLFFGGISIDKKYGGVHTKVPYKAVFLNPFYNWGARTLFGVRTILLNTMIHEIAHTGDMGHGEGHNTQMIKVEQYLADSGMLDYFRDAILDILTRHESTFTAMREAYGKSTTSNTSKSFEDYKGNSASTQDGRDRGVGFDEVGAVSAGEQSQRNGALQTGNSNPRPSQDTGRVGKSNRENERKIESNGIVTGVMHSSIFDAIKQNNLNEALRIAANRLLAWKSRENVFASQLADVLSKLNLPAQIVLDSARKLTRDSIDSYTKADQIQLFGYLRSKMTPTGFNKYFAGYDSVDNLEKVYEGLQELQILFVTGNPIINPVLAQFNKVLGAYDDNMVAVSALGVYFPKFDTISLETDTPEGRSYRVFLHEVVHAATEHMIALYREELTTDKELLTAEQREAIEQLFDLYNFTRTQIKTGEYGLTNISEFIAEMFTNKVFRDMTAKIPYAESKKSIFDRFVDSILRLVGVGNVASETMQAAYTIFSPQRSSFITEGAKAATNQKGKKRGSPYSVLGKKGKQPNWRSQESSAVTKRQLIADAFKGKRTWEEVRNIIIPSMWHSKAGMTRRFLARAGSNRQLADVTRGRFPQLQAAIRIVDEMVAYRNAILAQANEIMNDWLALQRADADQSRLLNLIMLESTIRKEDPTSPNAATTITPELLSAWNALSPEYKRLYIRVRDFYTDQIKRFENILRQNANNIADPVKRQKTLAKLNNMFSQQNTIRPYFPLRRFGNYWFQIGSGQFKEFYEFESEVDRDLAMNNRIVELQKGNSKQVALAETIKKGNSVSEFFSGDSAKNNIIEEVETLIDDVVNEAVKKGGATPSVIKDKLHDSIQQLFYVLLPQQSMRKMFIHRQNTQGASEDMLRVFATSAIRMAYQQARFKYANAYQNNLTNAHDYVNKYTDPNLQAAYRDYIYEIQNRANTILGTENKSVAANIEGTLAEMTFFMMLSAPASVILNVIGFTIVTLPSIGAKYGYAETSTVALKNLQRYLRSSGDRTFKPLANGVKGVMQMSFPSIVEGGGLSPLLKRAAKRFIADGDINMSMTHDMFDLSDLPTALYTGRLNAAKKAIAGPFHQMERLNREVTLMTTFELAFKKYLGSDRRDMYGVIERDSQTNQPLKVTAKEAFEMAIQDAKHIAGITLGDSARTVRSPWFSKTGIQSLLRFKQYAFTMVYVIGRNMYLSLGAPLSKAEVNQFRKLLETDLATSPNKDQIVKERMQEFEAARKETYRTARKMLAGIVGMAFLYGGIEALPGSSLAIWLLAHAMAGGDDDDDEFFDEKNWWRNYMERTVGGYAGAAFEAAGMEAPRARKWGKSVAESIERGPIATATGASLSERVGLDPITLLYRDGRYSPDTQQAFNNTLMANAGPVAGLVYNNIDAYKLFMEGQYQRAFEKMLPALFAKPLIASRLAEEGAVTPSGVPLVTNVTAWEVAMQAIGFQPERIAQAQQANIQANEKKIKITNQRAAIMDRFWLERNNPDGTLDNWERANEFSMKHPELKITPANVEESRKLRQKAMNDAAAYGVNVPKKLRREIVPMVDYGKD